MHLFDGALRIGNEAEEAPAPFEIDCSGLCQPDGAGGAVEKLDPQPLLQILHLLADPCLGCPQAFGRRRKAAPLGNFDEGQCIAHVPQHLILPSSLVHWPHLRGQIRPPPGWEEPRPRQQALRCRTRRRRFPQAGA